MASQENPRAWAFAAFAFSLFLFLAVFIPSLYAGALFGVISSMLLILGGLLVAYRMGQKGFADETTPPYASNEDEGQGKPTLDPDHVEFDEANWRRVHGSPPEDGGRRPG
jgi:hypothetical protein